MSRDGASRNWPAALAAGLVALLAQVPWCLPGAYLWDDIALLLSRDLYVNPARWVESVSVPLGVETGYWRPLATTSFLLESLVHGASASGFRVTAAVLHGVTAALACVLLTRLLRSRAAGLLAAAVWAVHPANVEAVTWISARFDLLAGMFTLGALVAVGPEGRVRGTGGRVAIAATTAAALLCKESAVTIPVLLLAWSLALSPEPGGLVAAVRRRWSGWGAALAGLGAVALLRLERLGFVFRVGERSAEQAGDALQHALLVGRAAAQYAETLLLPWSGVAPAHHGLRPIPSDDPRGWTGLVLLALLVVALLVLLRRRPRSGMLLGALLVALAPVLQILPLDLSGGLHAADRYLYVASFFAVALVADLAVGVAANRPALRRALLAAACVALVALGALRVSVLGRWTSPDRFWAWAVERAPDSAATLRNRISVLLGAGWPDASRLAAAEADARHLHRLDTEFEHAGPLIEILLATGRLEEAGKLAEQALRMNALAPEYFVLRGRVELAFGQPEDALASFRGALHAESQAGSPSYQVWSVEARGGAAEALLLLGRDRFQARDLLDRAEADLPRATLGGPVAVARARLLAGDHARSLADLGDGRRIPPTRWGELLRVAGASAAPDDVVAALMALAERSGVPQALLLDELAQGHEAAGRWERSVPIRARVAELVDDAAAWDRLGYARYEAGDEAGCEEALRTALERDARYGLARMHLGVLLLLTKRTDEGRAELEAALGIALESGDAGLESLVREQLARFAEGRRGGGR